MKKAFTLLIALSFAAALTANEALAQQAKPPSSGAAPGAGLEGGDADNGALPEPEAIPQLKPQDDITSIKPIPPELPDRTIELLGDTKAILNIPLNEIPNYRDEMRKIVEDLTTFARAKIPNFTVLTYGGFDLFTWSQREYDLTELKRPEMVKSTSVMDTELPVGFPMRRYQQRVDGFILDGFFCAPLRIPLADVEAMRSQSLKTLSVDHCPAERVQPMYDLARKAGIVAHIDTDMNHKFASIPTMRPNPENPGNVENMTAAKNMLVNLNNKKYGNKAEWILALKNTNYDVLVVDGFYNGNQALTKDEVRSLKFKKLGSRRLLLAWLDVGEAANDQYYWQREWKAGNPSWINALDRSNPGKFHIEFWNPAWKAIVGKSFAGLVDLGFDGIVLAGVDNYRRWEFMTPVN